MNSIPLRRSLAAAVLVVAAVLGSVVAVSAAPARASCAVTWGSLPRDRGTLGPAALLDARAGQHDCYDRVVFELDGPPDGYHVGYARHVFGQGRGEPLNIAGGAQLDVVLLANDHDIRTGVQTYPHRVGDHVAGVAGDRTLRDVVYGGSFEGYTTFGVGVRARLPFRVFTLAGPDSHSRVVLDVAHRW